MDDTSKSTMLLEQQEEMISVLKKVAIYFSDWQDKCSLVSLPARENELWKEVSEVLDKNDKSNYIN